VFSYASLSTNFVLEKKELVEVGDLKEFKTFYDFYDLLERTD